MDEIKADGKERILPFYSPWAEAVRSALFEVSNHDLVIKKFAERVARSITLYEAGFREQGPVGSFLFVVPQEASVDRIISTLAEEWFGGSAWDSSPAYFFIDCTGFTSSNPHVLVQLLGGPIVDQGSGRMYAEPQLAQITYPHFAVRAKHFLRNLSNWSEWFMREYDDDLKQLRRGGKLEKFQEGFMRIVAEEQRRHYEDLKKEDPFRSVVIFDGVGRFTHSGLINIIKSIIQQGSLTVWPNRIIDFSHSIVIVTAYAEENDAGKEEIGFHKEEDAADDELNEESEREKQKNRYVKGRKDVSSISTLAGLMQMIGDNVFVLRNKRFSDQRAYVLSHLREIQRRLHGIGISIDWSEEFLDRCARETKDQSFKNYTDGRVRTSVEKHILFPIAQFLLAGNLRQGAQLHFAVHTGNTSDFGGICTISDRGDESKELCPSDIQKLWMKSNIGPEFFDEGLIKSNEWLNRINEKALKLYQETAGV